MELLDDTHLEAAKRGAMITAALKWLLDKIPTTLFPPQIRPAIMVIKRLTPYLGYVGVFIAWSWTSIKARDKGVFLMNLRSTSYKLIYGIQVMVLC
jgi:hypothetical protein